VFTGVVAACCQQAAEHQTYCRRLKNRLMYQLLLEFQLVAYYAAVELCLTLIQMSLSRHGWCGCCCRIRFGRGSEGLTATTSGMTRPVYVQSTWMRSRVGPQYEMR
jgi:hypothetical protein